MIRILLAALAAALAGFAPAPAEPLKPVGLRAGAFAADVTPQSFPVSVNGGMADRQAKAATDPLHARCLVLDDGTTTLALVVVDSCMIPRELMDAAKALAERKTGIPAANMLISATHTHSAPTVAGVFQSEPDTEYQKFLAARVARGIEKAAQNLAPARAGSWCGASPPPCPRDFLDLRGYHLTAPGVGGDGLRPTPACWR